MKGTNKPILIIVIVALVLGLAVGAYFLFFKKSEEQIHNEQVQQMVGYVSFMDSNLYFDSEGKILESTKEVYPCIPEVTGLEIDRAVLGEVLPIEDKKVLSGLLEITSYLAKTNVNWGGTTQKLIDIVDGIYYDSEGGVNLVIDGITVKLGESYHLEEKLVEMSDILGSLEGRSGTLHLENYNSNAGSHIYTFD